MIALHGPTWAWWIGIPAACILALWLGNLTRWGYEAINGVVIRFVRALLWLRYRTRVKGIKEIVARGTSGILILPNHPAMIDPILVTAMLLPMFRQRSLADENQIDRFFVRWLAKRANVLPIPDPAKVGSAGRERIEAALNEIIAALHRGENVQLYPSGHVYRSRLEDLRGNSAVQRILQAVEDVRVVLVRTRGLWGSKFSYARGHTPRMGEILGKAVRSLVASFLVFMPRREVTIELAEPDDLPRDADRGELNGYLERFYNADADFNTYVPYTPWERGGRRRLPEPAQKQFAGDPSRVGGATRRIVLDQLREQTGVAELRDDARLAADLGLDSLAVAELMAWLESEFGFPQGNVESLQTVGDVLLAACGEGPVGGEEQLQPPSKHWFHTPTGQTPATADETHAEAGQARAEVGEARTVADAFLRQAARAPGRVIAADQMRGGKTYRDLVAAVCVLRPVLADLPGERVGIMLPAGVAADSVYLATVFAGKTPVMVNWTAGERNVRHGLDLVACRRVLTARLLVTRLKGQGIDLTALGDRLVYLEDVGPRISLRAKLRAVFQARFTWRSLRKARITDTAAILFTSGSESLPKAVPLSHANVLANLQDVTRAYRLYQSDRLLGMLPPFHSFGLTAGMLLPLLAGIPVAHHPNPTEGRMLGRIIDAYKLTLMLGTPTFLSGILRASTREQLASLRLAVTGAEKCPDRVYQALADMCPDAKVLEGYGVTECSPIVSANDEDDIRPGTIGKPLPSVECRVVDVDTGEPVPPGRQGMLLVHGPSVFAGYINYDGASPFVEADGRRWYRTGDLVVADEDGALTFRGRLKRFVKLGGEMISLPAIEAVLEAHFPPDESGASKESGPSADQGPVIAVQPTADEDHTELVLFTTKDITREQANTWLREGGLSGLHNLRRVIHLDELPLLGTGKTDYRTLARLLAEEEE